MSDDREQREPYLEQPPLEGERHFSVGRQLREVRETYELELEDVATALRIRPFYLQAIEETRYEDLPGATYAIGFVRAYADYLRLDARELVERFKQEVDGLETRRSLDFPVPSQEGRVPGVALLLVAVLLAALGYGVWYYLGQEGSTFTDVVEPLPEDLAALVEDDPQSEPGATPSLGLDAEAPPADGVAGEPTPPPAAEVVTEGLPAPDDPIDPGAAVPQTAQPEELARDAQPAEADSVDGAPAPELPAQESSAQETPSQNAPAQEAPAEEAPSQRAQDDEPAAGDAPADPAAELLAQDRTGAPQPLDETETDPAPQAQSQAADEAVPAPPPPSPEPITDLPEGRVYGAVGEEVRVVLLAEADSWVEVRDRQGRLVLSRVLRRGDSYRVPEREDLVMMTGNAGGLVILLDDRALPGLGETGSVRRDIPLAPDALTAEVGQPVER